jgi:hypothetical protein
VPHYRYKAREALKRGQAELASNDETRMRYAALEFRQVLESLTYDRAEAYKKEFPPEEYKGWRPRDLMLALLNIDPYALMTATISMGRQDRPGTPAPRERMRVVGTDHPLKLGDIKEHYDALGSYLHVQSPTGKEPNWQRLREHCGDVAKIAEAVLNSTIWNSTLGRFAHLVECLNPDCKKPVRRRFPPERHMPFDAQCFACKAEYTVTEKDDGSIFFEPKMTNAQCSNPKCKRQMALWPHEIKPGTHWRCGDCGTHNQIALSVIVAE